MTMTAAAKKITVDIGAVDSSSVRVYTLLSGTIYLPSLRGEKINISNKIPAQHDEIKNKKRGAEEIRLLPPER